MFIFASAENLGNTLYNPLTIKGETNPYYFKISPFIQGLRPAYFVGRVLVLISKLAPSFGDLTTRRQAVPISKRVAWHHSRLPYAATNKKPNPRIGLFVCCSLKIGSGSKSKCPLCRFSGCLCRLKRQGSLKTARRVYRLRRCLAAGCTASGGWRRKMRQ